MFLGKKGKKSFQPLDLIMSVHNNFQVENYSIAHELTHNLIVFFHDVISKCVPLVFLKCMFDLLISD